MEPANASPVLEGVRALPRGALVGDEPVLERYHLVLAPLPRHVGRAREFVRSSTAAAGVADVEALVLLTSELVSNVVIHARTKMRLGVAVTALAVVVTVHDLDLGRREVPSDVPRDGGRGMLLVEALAEAWAVERHRGGGKTVWFRLSRGQDPGTQEPAVPPRGATSDAGQVGPLVTGRTAGASQEPR